MRLKYLLLLTTVNLLVISQPIFASTCSTLFDLQEVSPWGYLRSQQLLLEQDRPGMCGPTCAINATQGALRLARTGSFLDLQTSYSEFIRQNGVSPKGGMTLGEIAQGIRHSIQQAAPTSDIQVKAYGLKNRYDNVNGVQEVDTFRPEQLASTRDKLVLIDVEVSDQYHQILGRHVQLVDQVSDAGITIIEPRAPYNRITLELDPNIRSHPRYWYEPEPFIFDGSLGTSIRVIGYIEIHIGKAP